MFNFENAERLELKGAFIQQTDLVFMNIPAKGYDKDTDVRYALSSDEFILELLDKTQRGKHQIRRLCQTLSKSIDVTRSEVQLLMDFIVVKLQKQEPALTWREFGYDIANFTVPQAGGLMKSNYLKSIDPAPSPVIEESKVEPKVNEAEKSPQALLREK